MAYTNEAGTPAFRVGDIVRLTPDAIAYLKARLDAAWSDGNLWWHREDELLVKAVTRTSVYCTWRGPLYPDRFMENYTIAIPIQDVYKTGEYAE